ncbi:MAG: hypothetical protein K0M49_12170 [Arenimonas sp.]|nr:hypothetical protein [Arenimonas sp.]
MSSVLQQISLALGVAVAAAILEGSTAFHGRALSLSDFHLAFAVVAGLSLIAVIPLIGLARHAGSAVSGHGRGAALSEDVPVK